MAAYRYFREGQLKEDPTTGTKCRTGQLNHQFVEQKFVGGVWVGIGDNDGVRYGDVAGAGCRFREGMRNGDYVVDVETEVGGFLLAENDGWENIGGASGLYHTPEYDAVLAAMPAPPLGNDQYRQRKWLSKMIDGGYFAKAELLDMFSADTPANSLINWKSPGTFDPELVEVPVNGVPPFRKYAGFKGKQNTAVRLHFTPSTDASLISQDNICVMIGIGDNVVADTDDIGARNSDNPDIANLAIRAEHSNGNAYFRINSQQATGIANANTIKYYTIVRNGANNSAAFLNKIKTVINSASDGLTDRELYACGYNDAGTIIYSYRRVRFVFVFSFLTDAEVSDVIDITEEYLGNYHTNIINYGYQGNDIATSDKATEVQIPLTTYDGSGQTCHPSVVNVSSVWNGYQYWMANTPLPGADSAYENPSIWASSDGTTWVVPAGLTNPIVAQPGVGFNSDTEIFFDNNKLYVVYREVLAGERLRIVESSDGITWSAPKTIFDTIVGEIGNLSPSIVKIGNIFYIYFGTYNVTYPPMIIKRVSCATIDGTYGNREIVNISAVHDGEYIWHFGMKVINGIYYLVSGQSGDIYISKSIDGINFTNKIYPLVNYGDQTWGPGLYRPCLEIIEGQATVYYGTTVNNNVFGCAKIDIDLL